MEHKGAGGPPGWPRFSKPPRLNEFHKPKRHHTPQLTNKMRKSIRPAIFIVAIFEPRCYWVLHELAILIELVVGVPLFLRITTTRIAVIVPQNPERAILLAQEHARNNGIVVRTKSVSLKSQDAKLWFSLASNKSNKKKKQ